MVIKVTDAERGGAIHLFFVFCVKMLKVVGKGLEWWGTVGSGLECLEWSTIVGNSRKMSTVVYSGGNCPLTNQ